jgi:predicted DNA-binding transcriptional regulator YafY
VELGYRSEDGRETRRTIWPIAVAYFDAQRLIIAWCELRQAFRWFRTDRMLAIKVCDEKYPIRRNVLLKQWDEQQARDATAPQVDVLA